MAQHLYIFRKYLVAFSGLLVFIIFLYLSGGLSFVKRSLHSSLCFISASRSCNRLLSLSRELPLLDQDTSVRQQESELVSQRVVLGGFKKEELLVWSYTGLVARFILTDKTTYGVAVMISKDGINKESFSNMLETEKLKMIDNSSYYLDKDGFMLIENPPGVMNRGEFEGIADSGNLLKIVYNENTKELIGILLLDFKRA